MGDLENTRTAAPAGAPGRRVERSHMEQGSKIDLPAASRAARTSRLGNLARFIARYRWPVIGAWIVLTLVGGVAAGKLSSRWYQSLAIPGKPAYEASLRTFDAFGAGVRPPNVVVFHAPQLDVGRSAAVRAAIARAIATEPGAL